MKKETWKKVFIDELMLRTNLNEVEAEDEAEFQWQDHYDTDPEDFARNLAPSFSKTP